MFAIINMTVIIGAVHIVVKSRGSGARLPEFKSWLCLLVAV